MSGTDGAGSDGAFASLIEPALDREPTERNQARSAPADDRNPQSDREPARDSTPAGPAANGTAPDRQPHASSARKPASRDARPNETPNEKISEKASETTATADDKGKTADAAATPAGAVPPSAAVPAAAVAPAPAPSGPVATSSAAAGTGPLAIASAAIAASTRDAASPPSPPAPAVEVASDAVAAGSTSIAGAVADAANDIAATNFEIAKAVTTPPAPGTRLTPEASAALQAQAEVAAAVTAEPVLLKPTLKADVAAHGVAAAGTGNLEKGAGKLTDAPPSPPVPQQPDPDATAANAQGTAATPTANAAKTAKPEVADATQRLAVAAKDTSADHRPAGTAAPQGPSTDATLQAATTVQPQVSAPAATGVPATQLGAAAATGLPVPLNGLAVQIAANAQNGRSRFEIRLDPAELGRIDVRLDVDRHGHVTSHLVVERPETLAMLRQDAPQLQRALEDAGLKTGNNGLQFSLRDQSSSGHNGSDGQSGRNAHRLIVADADTLSAVAAGRSYESAAGAMRGLDIRV